MRPATLGRNAGARAALVIPSGRLTADDVDVALLSLTWMSDAEVQNLRERLEAECVDRKGRLDYRKQARVIQSLVLEREAGKWKRTWWEKKDYDGGFDGKRFLMSMVVWALGTFDLFGDMLFLSSLIIDSEFDFDFNPPPNRLFNIELVGAPFFEYGFSWNRYDIVTSLIPEALANGSLSNDPNYVHWYDHTDATKPPLVNLLAYVDDTGDRSCMGISYAANGTCPDLNTWQLPDGCVWPNGLTSNELSPAPDQLTTHNRNHNHWEGDLGAPIQRRHRLQSSSVNSTWYSMRELRVLAAHEAAAAEVYQALKNFRDEAPLEQCSVTNLTRATPIHLACPTPRKIRVTNLWGTLAGQFLWPSPPVTSDITPQPTFPPEAVCYQEWEVGTVDLACLSGWVDRLCSSGQDGTCDVDIDQLRAALVSQGCSTSNQLEFLVVEYECGNMCPAIHKDDSNQVRSELVRYQDQNPNQKLKCEELGTTSQASECTAHGGYNEVTGGVVRDGLLECPDRMLGDVCMLTCGDRALDGNDWFECLAEYDHATGSVERMSWSHDDASNVDAQCSNVLEYDANWWRNDVPPYQNLFKEAVPGDLGLPQCFYVVSATTQDWAQREFNDDPSDDPIIGYSFIVLYAFVIMASIVFKETLKLIFLLSTCCCGMFRQSKGFKFVENSPFVAFWYLFHNYRVLTCQTRHENHTWVLLIDLLLEDAPQIFLPFYFNYINSEMGSLAFISLMGTMTVVAFNLMRFIHGCIQDIRMNQSKIDEELRLFQRQSMVQSAGTQRWSKRRLQQEAQEHPDLELVKPTVKEETLLNCPACDRRRWVDARFCAYCGIGFPDDAGPDDAGRMPTSSGTRLHSRHLSRRSTRRQSESRISESESSGSSLHIKYYADVRGEDAGAEREPAELSVSASASASALSESRQSSSSSHQPQITPETI